MYTHVSDIRHRRLMKCDIAVDDKKMSKRRDMFKYANDDNRR